MQLNEIDILIDVVKNAGKIIMKHYYNDKFSVKYKDDATPVTEADQESNDYILSKLNENFPEIPIISEEGAQENFNKKTDIFWLVDPLDGTTSFIRKGKNFTINIGLIKKNKAFLGIIYHPISGEIFYSLNAQESFKITYDNNLIKLNRFDKLLINKVIIGSNSSIYEERTKNFLETQKITYELTQMSSSLKFCRLAEGIANLYPRFGKTMEWDTAAGHAILKGMGGQILDLQGDELKYNKYLFINAGFVAYSKFK